MAVVKLPARRVKLYSHLVIIYSYFEKGCRKKGARQCQKVLRVVLSSLFFKEICKNGKRGHGLMFVIAKGKKQ